MTLPENGRVLIVGLGLLGGSYAMALTKKGYHVSAITRDRESIDYAVSHGLIDHGSTEVEQSLIDEADAVVFALYPHVFVEWIKQYGHRLRPGVPVTDVTGVKSCVVYEVQALLPPGVEFISAHPMAGRETSGVQNSDDSIFVGANYIVVPTEQNTPEAIAWCRQFGATLGFSKISVLSPEKHDSMIAFLSQLAHAIAVSLMCANDDPDLVQYTGDSFRDLTRIANINDEMWSELFLSNRDALLAEMDTYRETFDRLYDTIKNGDREAMREMMRLSTARRRQFNKKV
ncbi:MAG: prephenate dehydrogenase [Clostridia bacterium]|nr:prephenate dehydrogenase [Clostridia bacterium]